MKRGLVVWLILLGVANVASAAGKERIVSASETNQTPEKESHWSLKAIAQPKVPAVPDRHWKARNPIDNFVFSRLGEAKLSPSPEAPRRALIRRLYFDLIGLPPTPDEVRAFESDKAPDAYERLVERLLASPHYGERWARHWLDVVRFAETHGFEMNQPRPTAWLYRDYVIRAFNEDKPYDRFILEQFAGDMVGEDAATGFLVGGAWDQVKSPDPVLTAAQRADELHDMVSTTGSAFLGLTVGCARCHNHKFDPIPQTDYYAIKACLAGVQHGERKLRTAESPGREQEAEEARDKLARLEGRLAQFEPMTFTGQVLLIVPEPAFGSKRVQLVKPAKTSNYTTGTARGERDDPGDLTRLPNFTKSLLAWSNAANADVLAVEPGVEGRFHLYLSWACGSDAFAKDARYVLDADGDLTTTNDQKEIARVDERHFADGTGDLPDKQLWSGFYDAGIWQLSSSDKVVLRGGATEATVSAGVLALVGEQSGPGSPGSLLAGQFLRAPVNARRNVERFSPVQAKRVRFTISKTSDAEPCIDELEVYTAGENPTNIALAGSGTRASASSVFPNSDIHKIEHINDGKAGNSRSWISNERGKGWVELEFPQERTIERVVWGRDREQKFTDRLALEYRIEVAVGSNDWRVVASSQDRVPYAGSRPATPDFRVGGGSAEKAGELKDLLAERGRLEGKIKELTAAPMVYAGQLSEKEPEAIYRLHRGDPMQKREVVEPGVLSVIPVKFEAGATDLASARQPSGNDGCVPGTEDQRRRLALARWISDPANPLPARVMVNRLWQHHFGEGLVSTPSDFGKKGARPSHPELLDWLAWEFVHPTAGAGMAKGRQTAAAPAWSIKHIHRLIVTSATYRQASASRPEGMAIDAGCRLLWRFPPQRLEAEPLRDTILAVSGKLDSREGGPGFSPFEPNDNYVRVYNPKKEFGPAEWRRMVYMTKVRMQQDSTFGAFDCPDGGQIAPKRMRSTTPLQALNLLNSEFIVQQAGFFAERLERESGKKIEAQVRRAFELSYGRRPENQEMRAAQALIEKHGLPMFCRALFNSNEFIFAE